MFNLMSKRCFVTTGIIVSEGGLPFLQCKLQEGKDLAFSLFTPALSTVSYQ